MRKRWMIMFAALFGLGAAAAMAEVMDDDGNGTFSMEEMQAAYPDLTEETFAEIDSNADGAIDAVELAAAEASGLLTAS